MADEFLTDEDFIKANSLGSQGDFLDVPGTAQRQDLISPETEEANDLWKEAKAIGIETGIPLATAVASSPLLSASRPLLLGGPKGWLAYGLINFGAGYGSSKLAQKFRNPEKITSWKEATLNGVFSAVPGIAPIKTAKLGTKPLMAVRAGETAVMAGGEEFGRQLIDISEGEREALSPFEIGFASVIGTGLGAGMGRVESGMLNRAGVTASQAKKIQTQMEAHVADRINTIDAMLKKNPELGDGEMGRMLQKEREALAEQLTEVSRTDRQYLENIRKKAQEKKAEAEAEWAEMQAQFKKQPKVGEGTVLRPVKEGAEEVEPKPVDVEVPPTSKLTDEQKLQALDRMQMSDEDLAGFIEGKTNLLPVNIAAFSSEEDVQKAMAAVLEQVKDGVKKRGIKTDKASLQKRSKELMNELNPNLSVTKSLAYTAGVALKSEELIAQSHVADAMVLSAFKTFNKKLGSDLDFNNPEVVTDVLADIDRLALLSESSSTISSSAGKLLQSRKVSRDDIAAMVVNMEHEAAKAEKKISRDLIKYSKDLTPEQLQKQLDDLGGLKALKGLTNEFRILRDTGKLGKLLEMRKRGPLGKFGNMTAEIMYANILSGPVTQAAAAMGNAFMGIYSLSNQALGAFLYGDMKTSKHAIMTARNLLHSVPEAWEAAKIAAKNSKGQMALDSHYEKIGGKAFSMEETGINGVVGETIENLGELASFGPKGLVFQDEFYRHMFAKAQVKSLLSQEYKDLVAKGEAPVEGMADYIEGKMSRYFVDGKRYKTQNDVRLEAVEQAQAKNLDGDEAVEFIEQYNKDNWTNQLSSEMEYLKQFGDRITFQSDLKKGYSLFETAGTSIQELRQEAGAGGYMAQYVVPFIKTPVNIFKEFGGTTSQLARVPVIGQLWARSREELMSDNPMIKANARGRQIVGAGLWSTAIYLADQQIITNSGPLDYKELENKKATGWMPNAINVSAAQRLWENGDSGGDQLGDSYVSLQKADPAATITALAGDLMRAREDNDFSEDEFTYTLQTIGFALSRAVGQKSYLETVGGFLDALVSGRAASEDDYGSAILEDINRRLVPSALNSLGRSDDPYMREVNEPLEVILNRLPGYVKTLDPKRDAFGQKIPAYGGGLIKREINTFNPLTFTQTKKDRSVEAILKYRGAYAFPDSDKVIPGIDLKQIKVEGSNQSLYDRWKEIYSESDIKEAVINVYDNPDLKAITVPRPGNNLKEVQKEAINNQFQAYRDAAFLQLLEEYPMLEKQYEYNVELQMLQYEGKDLPKETVAPELLDLVK